MPAEPINVVEGHRRDPARGEPRRLPRARRQLAERGLDRRIDLKEISQEPGSLVEQSAPTSTGPSDGGKEIIFETYTPLERRSTPARYRLTPAEPTVTTASSCTRATVPHGVHQAAQRSPSTTHGIPTRGEGRPVDQVMIHVPPADVRLVVHTESPPVRRRQLPAGRRARGGPSGRRRSAWTSGTSRPRTSVTRSVATDRQDLAFSESRLYMTTNAVGQGRVVMSLSARSTSTPGRTVTWTWTNAARTPSTSSTSPSRTGRTCTRWPSPPPAACR